MALIPTAQTAQAATSAISTSLGLDFWGVPLACLVLTLGYLVWMRVADRREAAASRQADAP